MKKIFLIICSIFCLTNTSIAQSTHVSLLFAGDAMQHQSQLDGAKTQYGFDYSSYFKYITKQIDSADIAIVNLETTLPGANYTGYPCFGSPDEYAGALKDAGFNVFLTANNHSLDKRQHGLERTIWVLDSLNIKHLGTYVDSSRRELYYPKILIKDGIRIALLNYTYGTNGIPITKPNVINLIDKQQIKEDINLAKVMKSDIIIANMHWGEEYHLTPSKEQKDLAEFLVDEGVQIIVGSHPHVVQPIDVQYKNNVIKNITAYSLGNFISGMRAPNTDGGMMLKINLKKDIGGKVTIDNYAYSLVWVNKPFIENKQRFQLIPIDVFNNEEGKVFLGETSFLKMNSFANQATKTIESLTEKTISSVNKNKE